MVTWWTIPPPAKRLLLPPGTGEAAGAALRAQGWVTVAALAENAEMSAEARRLLCSHFLVDGNPVPRLAPAIASQWPRKRGLRRGFVTTATRRHEHDRGQQIVTSQRADQLMRRYLRRTSVHRTIIA